MKRILVVMMCVAILVAGSTCESFAELDPDVNEYVLERGESDYLVIPMNNDTLTLVKNSNEVNAYWGSEYGDSSEVWFEIPEDADLGKCVVSMLSRTSLRIYNFNIFVVDKTAPDIYSNGRSVWWHGDSGFEGGQLFQVQRRVKGGKWKTVKELTRYASYKAPKGTYQVRVRKVNYDIAFGFIYGKWATKKL